MILLLAKTMLLLASLACCLFCPSGNCGWLAGWLVWGAYTGLVALAFCLVEPSLMKERAAPVVGFDRVDAVWGSLIFLLLYPLQFWLAGLEAGMNETTRSFLTVAQWAGVLGFCIGYAVVLWAMVENRFFTTFVRIQADRSHRVIATGPYQWVRHPGYSGTLLAHLALPLALGVGAAWLPVVPAAGLLAVRILREEQTLARGLPGYRAYLQQTRWRLFPGLW